MAIHLITIPGRCLIAFLVPHMLVWGSYFLLRHPGPPPSPPSAPPSHTNLHAPTHTQQHTHRNSHTHTKTHIYINSKEDEEEKAEEEEKNGRGEGSVEKVLMVVILRYSGSTSPKESGTAGQAPTYQGSLELSSLQ